MRQPRCGQHTDQGVHNEHNRVLPDSFCSSLTLWNSVLVVDITTLAFCAMIFSALFHDPLKISGRFVIAKFPNNESPLVTGALLVSTVVEGADPNLTSLVKLSSSCKSIICAAGVCDVIVDLTFY